MVKIAGELKLDDLAWEQKFNEGQEARSITHQRRRSMPSDRPLLQRQGQVFARRSVEQLAEEVYQDCEGYENPQCNYCNLTPSQNNASSNPKNKNNVIKPSNPVGENNYTEAELDRLSSNDILEYSRNNSPSHMKQIFEDRPQIAALLRKYHPVAYKYIMFEANQAEIREEQLITKTFEETKALRWCVAASAVTYPLYVLIQYLSGN